MAEHGHGPFETEREASQTEAVRAVYAAFDADPGPGKMRPHNVAIITGACEKAGVVLGAFDQRQIDWIGTWEPHTSAVIAGLIIRAHEAGKAAATAGAVTQWGVRYTARQPGGGRAVTVIPIAHEQTAQETAVAARRNNPEADDVVVRREVGPWEMVPDA